MTTTGRLAVVGEDDHYLHDTPRPKITRERFIEATGIEPEHDDLERCNCPCAGELGHVMCGWVDEENLPRFMVGLDTRGAQ